MRNLKIFISSTILELHDERLLLKNDLTINNMDTFIFEVDMGARPDSAQKAYLDEVADSDLYIGLFWNQFSEATVEEFKHAENLGKPCFVYIKDFQVNRDPKLSDFLNQIASPSSGITYRRFSNILELVSFTRKDVQDWLVRQWRGSAEKRKKLEPFLRRLQEDAIHMVNLSQQTGIIKILESHGSPPMSYVVEYSMKGIIGVDGEGVPIYGDKHLVEFKLNEDYPFQLPYTRFKTPIFHPNIYGEPPAAICMGWHSLPYRLADVCTHVAEMIDYQVFTYKWEPPFPVNREAAEWAAKNLDLFPLTGWSQTRSKSVSRGKRPNISFNRTRN